VRAVWDAYRQSARVHPDDHVTLATSSRLARIAWFALPATGMQRLVRDGVNGADLALIEAVDVPHAASRYATLCLGSGDHIYVDLVARALAYDMRVRLVLGRGRPSPRLLAACPNRVRLSWDAHARLAA
jgi:hypothetical protein